MLAWPTAMADPLSLSVSVDRRAFLFDRRPRGINGTAAVVNALAQCRNWGIEKTRPLDST